MMGNTADLRGIPEVQVDQRETPPQVGETLRDAATGLTYQITKAYGECRVTLPLGSREITAYVFDTLFEDGEAHRLCMFQIYNDTFVPIDATPATPGA